MDAESVLGAQRLIPLLRVSSLKIIGSSAAAEDVLSFFRSCLGAVSRVAGIPVEISGNGGPSPQRQIFRHCCLKAPRKPWVGNWTSPGVGDPLKLNGLGNYVLSAVSFREERQMSGEGRTLAESGPRTLAARQPSRKRRPKLN